MIKLLLTAIGCPGGPSIIHSLRQDNDIYIVGTDMREDVPAKYLVDKYYQIPAGKDPDFIPFLLEIVKKEKIQVILPLATFELLTLSQNVKEFNKIGCEVCVSEYDSLLKANDRHLLYESFSDTSLVPMYKPLIEGNDIRKESEVLGYPDEKVVVKPFISHGSIGLRIIDDKTDLFENYINKKPNTLNIPMSFAEEIFKNQKPKNILLSEYLPGKEYGIDLLIHPKTGKVLQSLVRDNGEVFHSEISNGKLIHDDRFLEVAKMIISRLKLSYTINIDFKLDKNGEIKLLEINPRLPATSFLAFSAGYNLPLFSIYLALGKDLPQYSLDYDRRIYSYRGFLVRNENGEILIRN
jgi:carbamoyl-phosphate synthase large subunit